MGKRFSLLPFCKRITVDTLHLPLLIPDNFEWAEVTPECISLKIDGIASISIKASVSDDAI